MVALAGGHLVEEAAGRPADNHLIAEHGRREQTKPRD